ncbi:MAG: TetR/AcrR family transcriptional regulator [Acidimicrobiales bacterium]|nr:TetR/AcrR family transcriptional regulator [Acidimicrobiales bacterium]
MPRINADTIADHVAQQRAAVLDAAVQLFTTRGYAEVSLADVAAEVGLARSSLYRYVPDKLHLLVEWYRQAAPATVEAWQEAVAGDDPPAARAKRWARAYLTWARTPEHQLVAPLTEGLGNLDEETRTEVATLHRAMMDVVAGVVADAGIAEAEVSGTVELLAGLTLGAARAEAVAGRVDEALRRRLDDAIDALL